VNRDRPQTTLETLFLRYAAVFLIYVLLTGCGRRDESQTPRVSSPGQAQELLSYAPRIGVGVSTPARTCVALANATVAANTPVTIISPLTPQTLVTGQISGPASETCPVHSETDANLSSYDLRVDQPGFEKLKPVIVILGNTGKFSQANGVVTADLNQNGNTQMFRACSSSDQVYLTMWSGRPLEGTIVWHGRYYSPDNPGLAPVCTTAELKLP
jgi:hypothetical protein